MRPQIIKPTANANAWRIGTLLSDSLPGSIDVSQQAALLR